MLLKIKNSIFWTNCATYEKNVKKYIQKIEREYRDENVFLKVNRALSKLIILLILIKLSNLHQNAKRDENVRAKTSRFFFYINRLLKRLDTFFSRN